MRYQSEVCLNSVEHLRWNFFVKIINDFKPLLLQKSPIVDFQMGSTYAFVNVSGGFWGIAVWREKIGWNILTVEMVVEFWDSLAESSLNRITIVISRNNTSNDLQLPTSFLAISNYWSITSNSKHCINAQTVEKLIQAVV